jgi:AcrR family transcriptional regulator
VGRAPKFTTEAFVGHATVLAANRGPDAVTMVGVAKAAGVPSGSVYHRFDSRPHLLAEVWKACLEGFQRAWWTRAEHASDPVEVAVMPVQWARRNREHARVLMVHSADRFVVEDCPPSVRAAIERLQKDTATHLRLMADRFLGSTDRAALERTALALTGVPLAVLRRPLTRGEPISQSAEALVRETAECLLRTESP